MQENKRERERDRVNEEIDEHRTGQLERSDDERAGVRRCAEEGIDCGVSVCTVRVMRVGQGGSLSLAGTQRATMRAMLVLVVRAHSVLVTQAPRARGRQPSIAKLVRREARETKYDFTQTWFTTPTGPSSIGPTSCAEATSDQLECRERIATLGKAILGMESISDSDSLCAAQVQRERE